MITSLYGRYFQKSRTFLFPLLEIPKSKHPQVQTFLSLTDVTAAKERKLICLFQHSNTKTYLKFEKEYLFENPFYESSQVYPEHSSIYIFNLKKYDKDWEVFLKGKYSQLSDKTKFHIRSYYGEESDEYEYVDTYLYPDRYFSLYSKLLNEPINTLEKVGELCNRYDPEKESLVFSTKYLDKSTKFF